MSVFAASTSSSSSSLPELLHKVSRLSISNQRAVAAVVGASVGDAATRPFHWLYDRAKLEKIVGDKDPAYWPVSVSPYYTMPTGRRSCYNDLGICTLTAMNAAPAHAFVEETYIKTMSTFFSSDSEYAEALKRRKEAYTPDKRLEDREPIEGPWQQGAVSNFLSCLEKGEPITGSPESKETDGLCTTIPLIARLAAEEAATPLSSSRIIRDSEIIMDAAKLLSSNPFALRHTLAASRVLRNIVLNGVSGIQWDTIRSSVLDGENGLVVPGGKTIMIPAEGAKADEEGNKIEVDYLLEEMNQISTSLNTQEYHTNAVERWGRQCANPGSFQGAILAVTSSTSFEEGIRKVILAGGCNCSRANFAGACLGAAYGFQYNDSTDASCPGIPFSWLEKCDRIEHVLRMALEKIVV